jgi:hypothetical protein
MVSLGFCREVPAPFGVKAINAKGGLISERGVARAADAAEPAARAHGWSKDGRRLWEGFQCHELSDPSVRLGIFFSLGQQALPHALSVEGRLTVPVDRLDDRSTDEEHDKHDQPTHPDPHHRLAGSTPQIEMTARAGGATNYQPLGGSRGS